MDDFLTFVAGAAIGGLLSWLITHRYYAKSGADQKAELAKLQAALKPRNTLNDFENLLRTSTWTKAVVGHTEHNEGVRSCEQHNESNEWVRSCIKILHSSFFNNATDSRIMQLEFIRHGQGSARSKSAESVSIVPTQDTIF